MEMPVVKRCPRDQTELRTLEVRQLVVDYCHHCGGVWMELGEFAKLTGRPDSLQEIEAKAEPEAATPADAGFDLCPAGHGTMERYTYASTTQVQLDRCQICGGIWLDDEECAQVASRIRTGPKLTPEQAGEYGELAAEHARCMDRLAAEKAFVDAFGRRRFWLDPTSWE